MKYSKNELQKFIKECYSKTDLAVKLGYTYVNGKVFKKIDDIIEKYELDDSHFDPTKKNKERRRYNLIEKKCPVPGCNNSFITEKDHRKEKITCSYSCSNTYFRSGKDHPNWKEDSKQYRTTCFEYHEKKCIICGEDKIVDVHHYDEDNSNNVPGNLIPLCPTHHRYVHSCYKDLVQDKIEEYKNEFIERNK